MGQQASFFSIIVKYVFIAVSNFSLFHRGGHRGRDTRGGMDSRGRGGMMDRGRGEGNDRGGNKTSWGQHRGGSASSGSVVARNPPNQFSRGQQRIQNVVHLVLFCCFVILKSIYSIFLVHSERRTVQRWRPQ